MATQSPSVQRDFLLLVELVYVKVIGQRGNTEAAGLNWIPLEPENPNKPAWLKTPGDAVSVIRGIGRFPEPVKSAIVLALPQTAYITVALKGKKPGDRFLVGVPTPTAEEQAGLRAELAVPEGRRTIFWRCTMVAPDGRLAERALLSMSLGELTFSSLDYHSAKMSSTQKASASHTHSSAGEDGMYTEAEIMVPPDHMRYSKAVKPTVVPAWLNEMYDGLNVNRQLKGRLGFKISGDIMKLTKLTQPLQRFPFGFQPLVQPRKSKSRKS